MKWISVEDRLPGLLDTVLVCITNEQTESVVCEAMFQYGDEFITPVELVRHRFGARPCVGVTHWMPLPEPPVNN